MAAGGLDLAKIFNTTLSTPQVIVVFLVLMYVVGGVYLVMSTKSAKAKEKKDT
jgi:hypothetical protein